MRSLIRFGLTGILATMAHAAVFVLLIEVVSLRPVYAAVPAFLTALGVSYGLNYRWTFGAEGPHHRVFPRFVLVCVTGLLLNLLITYLVVDRWLLGYGYALLAVVTLVPPSTYLLSRFWVFNR